MIFLEVPQITHMKKNELMVSADFGIIPPVRTMIDVNSSMNHLHSADIKVGVEILKLVGFSMKSRRRVFTTGKRNFLLLTSQTKENKTN